MKGFSAKLELICRYTDEEFSHLSQVVFADLKVYPVPLIMATPFELRNDEMNLAVHYQKEYHRERKEREKKG